MYKMVKNSENQDLHLFIILVQYVKRKNVTLKPD